MRSSPPSPPISVLRKSGSSTCLQPRNESGHLPSSLSSSTNLFTIVHTEELASYSAERYYILSELQLKAHSISFLSEWDAGRNYHDYNLNFETDQSDSTQEMSFSSWGGEAPLNDVVKEESIRGCDCDEKDGDKSTNSNSSELSNAKNNIDENAKAERGQTEHQHNSNLNLPTEHQHNSNLNLPPAMVLYLLWRYDSPHAESPELFANHYIRPCVQKIVDAYESIEREQEVERTPHIYVVIDRICSEPTLSSSEDEYQQCEDYKARQMALTKELIQVVATNQTLKLRSLIEGITVGISTNVRAAPGLEQCMDAVMIGDSERRLMLKRNGPNSRNSVNASTNLYTDGKWSMEDPQCSCIGIITDHPDDLVGLDPTMDADAVQGMDLHLRMYAEWCGGGNVLNFATRSQKIWRTCFLKGLGEGIMSTNDGLFCGMDQIFTTKSSIISRGRRRQQQQKAESRGSKDMKNSSDNISNIMVAVFLAFMCLQVKNQYGEEIISLALYVYKMFQFK